MQECRIRNFNCKEVQWQGIARTSFIFYPLRKIFNGSPKLKVLWTVSTDEDVEWFRRFYFFSNLFSSKLRQKNQNENGGLKFLTSKTLQWQEQAKTWLFSCPVKKKFVQICLFWKNFQQMSFSRGRVRVIKTVKWIFNFQKSSMARSKLKPRCSSPLRENSIANTKRKLL
jgi:hypothetical protein